MYPAQSKFYHSEKLQSTKTIYKQQDVKCAFYHSEKLQSTKTIRQYIILFE